MFRFAVRPALPLAAAAACLASSTFAAEFVQPTVSGTTPSGLQWTYVATGSAMPVLTSSTHSLNGQPGAVCYFDTRTGLLQIDPKGLNLRNFYISYTTGTANVIPSSTPGPFTYPTGSGTFGISGATGTATQRTFPAGQWNTAVTGSAVFDAIVSLNGTPTLTTVGDPGNIASTNGWFNQPWAFPADLIVSGSLATINMAAWTATAITGSAGPNANVLGWGSWHGEFKYAVYTVNDNQAGPVIPYTTNLAIAWSTTSGTWTTSTAQTPWSGGNYFAAGDTVTFGTAGSGSVAISGTVAPASFTISGSESYTFTSSAGNQITGTTGLVKQGAGAAVFSGPNAYTGTTALQAGTLRGGDDAAFGSGVLAIAGGTIASADGAARVFGNAVVMAGNVAVGDATGTGGVTFSNAVDLGGTDRTFTTVADATLSGTVSHGGLTKTGAGRLTLTAADTYSGATIVNTGTLALSGAGAIASSVGVNISNSGAALDISAASGDRTINALSGVAGSAIVLGGHGLTAGDATSTLYGGVISGSGGFTKAGAGMITLTAANTFTGATTVSTGTLRLVAAGSLASKAVVVAPGATLDRATTSQTFQDLTVNGALAASGGSMTVTGLLKGSGTIAGLTLVSGTHAPGNSPGVETFENISYQVLSGTGPLVQWELAADTATQGSPAVFDQIVVTGTLDFTDATKLQLVFNGAGSTVDWTDTFWAENRQWTVYDVGGTTTNFANLAISGTDWLDGNSATLSSARAGSTFSLTLLGQDVILNYQVAAVPEPATWALGLAGLACAGWAVRRRRRRAV